MSEKRYDYYEAVTADIIDYIRDNINAANFADRQELSETLNDTLWTEDSVTGNGSGSYTFNSYTAEEYVCHNLDLLGEALDEWGGDVREYLRSAETADVTIRCYILGECIDRAIDEIRDELIFADDDAEIA